MPLWLYILVSLLVIVYFVQLDWNPDFPSIEILYNHLYKVDLCKLISFPKPDFSNHMIILSSLPLQETKVMYLYVLSSIVVLAVENQFMSLLDAM